jgi:hypothetical protein
MRNTSILILALFVTFTAFSAHSEDKNSGFLLLNETREKITQSQRIEIAKELLNKIKALDAYIPSLTPKESQWLDAEWNSLSSLPFEASNQKAFKLTSSTEYQTSKLKKNLETIRLSLECAQKQAGVSIKREMFCWASATHELTDPEQFNDAIRILVKNGKISLPSTVRNDLDLGSFPGDEWRGFNMYGRLIQGKIVLPYMADIISK